MAQITFLQNLRFQFMGPMYLSSSLKAASHDCSLFIGERAEEFLPDLEASGETPILAFSVMTGMHRWAVSTARELKKRVPRSIIIFGGPHATFFPEVIEEDGVDAVCLGEGEEALVDLACAVDAGRDFSDIPNLWVKLADGSIRENPVRPLCADLDTLPLPDRNLYARYPDIADDPVKVVISSRGCPYDCTFCFNHQMMELYRGKGPYFRQRSPENVLKELLRLKETTPIRRIYFADDTFAISRSWLKEFLPVYGAQIGLPFQCLVRINQIDDEIAGLMSRNGCRTVFFGIESGDETIRNCLLKKGVSDSEIVKGAAVLKRTGIRFKTYNIVGFPGETIELALKTVEMNIAIGADYPWCSIFTPYPGTELARYAQEHGYLDARHSIDDVGTSFFIDSLLKNPDGSKIVNLQKLFQTAVIFPSLLPLVRLLIRLPGNPLFRLWFGVVYFILYVRSEDRSLFRTFRAALHNAQFFRKE